jgi:hypothetical protein
MLFLHARAAPAQSYYFLSKNSNNAHSVPRPAVTHGDQNHMVVHPSIRTINASWHTLSSSTSLPPQPPPSSAILKRADDALRSSSTSYPGGGTGMGYEFEVEGEVLARAKARESGTARDKSIELDLTGTQVDSFDNKH